MIIADALRADPDLNRRCAVAAFLVLVALKPTFASASPSTESSAIVIKVNRAAKRLSVVKADGTVLLSAPVGIGKGGSVKKVSMDDFVTPTGRFVVNLILTGDAEVCKASEALKNRYWSQPQYRQFLQSPEGLVRLFKNMSSLDFDGDGKGDTAYGGGYIGLALDPAFAANTTLTQARIVGPGARIYQDRVYWYSIALHGTPNEAAAIGHATSGGCVHVDSAALQKLLKLVSIGTRVEISDRH
ncbi:MAG: L,D-transpeptidase [Candidatus Obscuribacterales bacterium]|nr:L,D-transpeptidase [Candidatus Obscuribacterales bacterium]